MVAGTATRNRFNIYHCFVSLFWVGWFVGLAINAVVFPTFERTGPSSVLRILEFLPFATQNATQVANIATSNIILSENRLFSTYYGEPCWVRTSDLLIKSPLEIVEKQRLFRQNRVLFANAILPDTEFCRNGKLPKKPVVYFIAGGGLVKIGRSNNVRSRYSAIRSSSPVPVQLVALFPANPVIEAFLHTRFGKLHHHGEWFKDNGEIAKYVSRMAWRGKIQIVEGWPPHT